MEDPNGANYTYNYKKASIVFETLSTICVQLTSERKTRVEWVAIIRWKMQKIVKMNKVSPKRSAYCFPNLDEMIMRSPCQKAYEKYNGDEHT